MTALIDFGTALIVMGGWFFAAIFVALLFGAIFHGAKMRDYDPGPSDVDYDKAYETLGFIESERIRREAATKRALERLDSRRGKAA